MTRYRVRVHAEIVAVFEVEAKDPDDAVTKTLNVQPKSMTWLTPGSVVAIEEKTLDVWSAVTPEEAAVVEKLEANHCVGRGRAPA